MAWTRKLPSGKYAGRYRASDGRSRTVAGGPYRHKAAALRAASTIEGESRRPGWRGPESATKPWADWWPVWWASRTVEASTLATDEQRVRSHILPRWGHVQLGEVSRHDVQSWIGELRSTVSAGTARRVLTVFAASFSAAVDAEILTTNPAARISVGGGQASHERYLTHNEVENIAEFLHPRWQAVLYVLAYTGMRWSEAAGLSWRRVDRERGMVLVAETWSENTGTLKQYPKGKRRRNVPMPAWLLDSLEAGDPVLKSPHGKRPMLRNFRRAFDAAQRFAGVDRARVHDLRHTYASWLLQAGIPLAEVGRLLGHMSPQTTARYAHLAETPSEDVLAALGGAGVAQKWRKQPNLHAIRDDDLETRHAATSPP